MHTLIQSRSLRFDLKLAVRACLPLMALVAASAQAQNDDSESDDRRSLALGVAAVTVEKPYTGFDRKNYVFPMVSYENRWISASVPTLDFKATDGEYVSLRLRARWSGDGYEASDSPSLSGMDERKGGIWVGGAVEWKAPFARLSAEYLTDASGESKGARAKIQADRRFSTGKFGITPRLAAEWVDDKFVDYYFGVRAHEATTLRQVYAGEATVNTQVGLRVDYMPSARHVIFVDVGMTQFGNKIKDSPLVDKSSQTTIAGGYIYRF